MTSDKGLKRNWSQRNRNKPWFSEAWMNFAPCAIESWNRSLLPKTYRYLVAVILWREDAYKIASSVMTKNSWQTFVELHASLSSNLVKLVTKSPKKCGKKKARWVYASSVLPVKETVGRSAESVSVSKVPWDLVIEADDYSLSNQTRPLKRAMKCKV